MSAEPAWREAAKLATAKTLASSSRAASARLALAELLARAGYPVGLVRVHTWTRAMQGIAYQFAAGRVYWGDTGTTPPSWVAAPVGLA